MSRPAIDPPGTHSQPAPAAALPSPLARMVAFGAICLAGICGGLIGYAVTDIQTAGDGGLAANIGGVIGAVVAAGGVAVVAVLALRAMTEWRSIEERRQRQSADDGN
ncbi:MAG: hypothetical protein JJE52_15555 [Acidimicrobiia bacterium]|nr:hypothetical protein [Acidimicrobiia bacterium]